MKAFADDRLLVEKNYYSIGGGFVIEDGDTVITEDGTPTQPYPYTSAAGLLAHCRQSGLSLSGLVLENERALHTQAEIDAYFNQIWQTMRQSMERGMKTEGVLPGPFRVPRRAAALHRRLAGHSVRPPARGGRGCLPAAASPARLCPAGRRLCRA